MRFWAFPILATLALMSALAALYLGGIVNPITNLRHFPIAVVNEDAGPWGAKLVEGLVHQADKNTYDIRVLTHDEAERQLDSAKVYGELLIPPTFSSNLTDFSESAVSPTRADRPSVTIFTNQRAGTLGSSIAGQTLTKAMAIANSKWARVFRASRRANRWGAVDRRSVTRAGQPHRHQVGRVQPVAERHRQRVVGLLLRALAVAGRIHRQHRGQHTGGFDARLCTGRMGPGVSIRRTGQDLALPTLMVKWAIMVVLALLTSAVYMAIAHGLGMPIPLGWQLWLYGVFAISAVGVTSSSLIAVLGSMGLLFSMLVFVILGLPSAGATVPLEAVPTFFRWLAEFEPMHQVFLGVRALLYLNGRADAGLTQALLMTAIGLVIGLLVGGIITNIYDRSGFHRIPGDGGAERTRLSSSPGRTAKRRQSRADRADPKPNDESPSEQT